jgi:hypothetical protein
MDNCESMTRIRAREHLTKQPSEAKTLVALEHETWRLIQRKNLNGFASHLAEEFYDIFPDGTERTKVELLEFLREAELRDFRLEFVLTSASVRFADENQLIPINTTGYRFPTIIR